MSYTYKYPCPTVSADCIVITCEAKPQSRISEGWTYRPVRDDGKKETPCLVPYEELPEIEKAYDRDTAFNTLKYIVSLGFQISK